MKLVLMGTGPFAVPGFEALRDRGDEIAMVVTKPEVAKKSRGGPPPAPVRDWADANGLPIFDPTSVNDAASVERLKEVAADLFVVCDYGQILSSDALAAARLGGVNLHGSLLPKYRGAAPVQWSVLNGDAVAGVSVLHMTPKLDGGPILATAEVSVGDEETAGELEERLSHLGVDPLLRAVDDLARWNGTDAIGDPQQTSAVTKAPRLTKLDGEIDWGRDAAEIHCHVRGMSPWPTAYTFYQPESATQPIRLAIEQIRVTDESIEDHVSGELRVDQGTLQVATGDRWIEVLRLKPAGKREMSGEEFVRGHRPPVGSRFFS